MAIRSEFLAMINFLKPTLIVVASMLCFGCSRTNEPVDEKSFDSVALRHLAEYDVDLAKPQPGEWLYVRAEHGQTFRQYKSANPVTPGEKRKVIYLQPIGDFTPIQRSVVEYTAQYLEIFFGLETRIQTSISDSIIPSTSRRMHPEGQEQLFSTHILDSILSPTLPDDAVVLMAVTAMDLYPGPSWNFVFGQARLKHRVGVSSIFRFSIAEMDSMTYPVCLARLIKTSSHEIGHMFTMQHCINGVCIMNGSNSLDETDKRPNRLCSECLSKLQWNIGFDLQKRSHDLQSFFNKHKLQSDYDIATRDVDLIDQLQSRLTGQSDFDSATVHPRDCSLQKDSLSNEMFLLVPDQRAEPVGGLPALAKEISRTIKIPRDKASAYSTIHVAFIVDSNGALKGERALRQSEPEAVAQLFKAAKNLKWKPATCNGKPVSSMFVIPIHLDPEM